MSITVTGQGQDQVGVGEAPFEVSLEIPDDYHHLSQAAPALKYPIEIATAANFDIPVTGSPDAPETEYKVWPSVDSMPEDGLIFWLLRGDVAFDYQKVPAAGIWFEPEGYVFLGSAGSATAQSSAAPGEAASTAQPFGMSDAMGSQWANAFVWARLIPVAGPDGEIAEEPPYLVTYCFAGRGGAPMEDADELLTSVSVRYNGA
jgi:hypothetical protein